jgi:hypothetical protein
MTSIAAKNSEESGKQNIDMMIMQAKASQKSKERRGLSKRLVMTRRTSGFLKCCECNRTVAWAGFAKSQRTKVGCRLAAVVISAIVLFRSSSASLRSFSIV